jgi:hypothetical protein
VVDKPQVFAMRLNREKLAENARQSIRRKFSIATRGRLMRTRPRVHAFETMSRRDFKRVVHHHRRLK